MRAHIAAALLLGLLSTAGCQKTKARSQDQSPPTTSTASGSAAPGAAEANAAAPTGPAKDIDSKDILARPTKAADVQVKHVLVGWKDLAATYQGQMDPRAAARSNDAAAQLALDTLAKLKAKPGDIDALVKELSEDPGAQTGEPYRIKEDTPFVPPFKELSLRLKENEAGIVKTDFGYHVILRVPPPAPDPLESAEILKRPAGTEKVWFQHVLIGWKDSRGNRDPRAQARDKAAADKLASDTLAKVAAGGDMGKLMKELSEDADSKDNARAYDVDPASGMVEPIKDLALRLKLDEAGLAKTPFGWHVIKRVAEPPPPPPDSLDSVAILKRAPTTEKAKVKHILLGWSEVSTEDPRGKGRTRAQLETLVKATIKKLQGGAKIEPLMKELSEDPGSAASGTDYEVTPTAGLVPPFKELSLRLKVGEVGAVKTDFGIHIIQRVE